MLLANEAPRMQFVDEELARLEREVMASLLALVPAESKGVARDLVRKLNELREHRLSSSERKSSYSQRFVNVSKAIEAVVLYLEEEGRPMTKDELCTGVRAGGWKGGGRELHSWIGRSIELFLNPEATGGKGKRAPIKRIGNLIGLKTWDDKLWDETPREEP